MLELKNVSVIYKKDDQTFKAVDGVSLKVNDGETLGLAGESGSGKSTVALSILKLIASAGEITSGEILWNGEDILKLSDKRLRALRGNEIAMIFQDPFSSLNPAFTVGDQILEAVLLHQGLKKLEAKEKVIELLQLVCMPDPAGVIYKYPHELSGGMRQRAMIAMALAGTPELLIADEPTTALDVTIQAEILKLLKDIQVKLGMSIILITHNLALVYGFCDRVCIMHNGLLIEEGIVRDIFAEPKTQHTRDLIGSIPKAKWGTSPPL
jgi:ABC-type dipeptide/oligopeptide/nickel transport system ATPase component